MPSTRECGGAQCCWRPAMTRVWSLPPESRHLACSAHPQASIRSRSLGSAAPPAFARPLREELRPLAGWTNGYVVRQLPVTPEQVVIHHGLPIRAPQFSVVDAALVVDRGSALAILDSALHTNTLTPAELTAAVSWARHRRGIVEVRKLLMVADGRAESPLESLVRLACLDGDVPPDDLQHEVYDDSRRLVAVGDLAWLVNRRRPLLGEADGESVHGLPEPVYRDRRRGVALVGESCDTVRFTYEDTRRRGYIAWAVKNALRSA
jgi:hypothetical protein